MDLEKTQDRRAEWFVPSRGPLKIRILIGMLFLPYTGMVLAFILIGSMLAETVHWDRVAAILAIYFLALGVSAHALGALGSKTTKPWGRVLSETQLWTLAILPLLLAYGIGVYYMITKTPLLWLVAILEGFFCSPTTSSSLAGVFTTTAASPSPGEVFPSLRATSSRATGSHLPS
ncbi:MAG: hypothetical protein ACOY4L_06905 [Pseudomonadota bacterium]